MPDRLTADRHIARSSHPRKQINKAHRPSLGGAGHRQKLSTESRASTHARPGSPDTRERQQRHVFVREKQAQVTVAQERIKCVPYVCISHGGPAYLPFSDANCGERLLAFVAVLEPDLDPRHRLRLRKLDGKPTPISLQTEESGGTRGGSRRVGGVEVAIVRDEGMRVKQQRAYALCHVPLEGTLDLRA